MIGIYSFRNKINNKRYIGQSINLEERKQAHYRNYKNHNHNSYNTDFYKALREYGEENFEYEILYNTEEILSIQQLNELEIYYIEQYDSFQNGYNMNRGGNYTSNSKKLTEKDILNIYNEIENTSKTFAIIAEEFDLCGSYISMINQGLVWGYLRIGDYPLRKDTQKNQQGGNNGNAKLTDEEVIQIRKLFVNHTLPQIMELYPEVPFNTIKKIVYGSVWKHLPIYKKREKVWIYNNITCTDYPRLEE